MKFSGKEIELDKIIMNEATRLEKTNLVYIYLCMNIGGYIFDKQSTIHITQMLSRE